MSTLPILGPIRQNDWGTVIELTIKELVNGVLTPIDDLATATAITMTFRRPNGAHHKTVVAADVGGSPPSGAVTYTLVDGDIDEPGNWPVQARASWINGKWRTTEAILKVQRSLDDSDGQ